MGRYILWRIATVIPVLVGVSLAIFLMLHVLPSDPVQVMLTQTSSGTVPNAAATEVMIADLRHQLGLDRPLYVQYFSFVWDALHGSLGHSYRSSQPVSELLLSQYPFTLNLALAGMTCAVVLGLGLGVAAGLTSGSWIDRVLMLVATFGIAAPAFWLGLMLIYVFALTLKLLPVLGTGSPAALIMPAITLGLPGAAIIARLTRSNLVSVFKEDFMTTARAKGLPESMALIKHAMPNVMLPVLTVAGLEFGNLMTGAVIVETVFSRPGIGKMGVDAILQSDYPIVQGFALVIATTYVLVNLAVDLLYAVLDPRIKYE